MLRASLKRLQTDYLTKSYFYKKVVQGNGQPGAEYHLIIQVAVQTGLDCRSVICDRASHHTTKQKAVLSTEPHAIITKGMASQQVLYVYSRVIVQPFPGIVRFY